MKLALLLLCMTVALASAGFVQTTDGRRLEGKVRLQSDGTLLVTRSNAPPERVLLSNLLRADFTVATNRPPQSGNTRLKPSLLDEDKGALPPPWRSLDIGETESPGSSLHSSGTFSVAGGHRARHGREDGFHFVYQPFKGDGEIIARVASIEPRDEKVRQVRAGVLMRSSLEPASESVFMSVSGGLGTYFRQWGRNTTRAVQDRRPDLKPPYWIKLVRDGNHFTGYQSTDGRSWRLLATATAEMPRMIFVGLALVNARKGSELASATLDHVSLAAATLPGRFTPQVVLRDGTVIADAFSAASDSAVSFSRDKQGLLVLTRNVARLVFQPLGEAVEPGRTGLLLRSGDFIDGEFRGLSEGRVKVSSVLFGQKSYELKNKVAAVVLRDVMPEPAAFEVRTLEGSLWRSQSLAVEQDAVRVEAPLAGAWRIAASELIEVRRVAPGGNGQ
jgi:hypothetical protein